MKKDHVSNWSEEVFLTKGRSQIKKKCKIKFTYNASRTAFDGKVIWNFLIGSARNVVVSDVDYISSSHTDNVFLIPF